MKARKTLWNKKKLSLFSYSIFLGILLSVGISGYSAFLLTKGAAEQEQLNTQSVVKQAVVIDEKNYFGNSPVSHQFAYSFEFATDGKKYTGNTRDSRCRVGDVIKIKYVPANPSFNAKLD